MIYRNGKFLYRGCIVNNPTTANILKYNGRLSVFAMPVPGGRIVEYESKENIHNISGRNALYKVNVIKKGEYR